MINKKITLTVSLVTTLIVLSIGTLEPFKLCGDSWRSCMDVNYTASIILLPVVPFTLFAIITFFLSEDVYKIWLKVALGWLVISMIAIFMTTDSSYSGFGPGFGVGKGDTAFVTSVLAAIISLGTIIWARFMRKA